MVFDSAYLGANKSLKLVFDLQFELMVLPNPGVWVAY